MAMSPSGRRRARPKVDAGRLWAGGLATAVTAALVSVVGILIARGIFDVPVLAPKGEGTWGDADTGRYALYSAAAALVATALIHGLILFVPRYRMFFTWIMVLVTAVAALAPFAVDTETAAQVATGLINLILGVTIGSLVAGVARSAVSAAEGGGADGAGPYSPEAYPPDSYPPEPYPPR